MSSVKMLLEYNSENIYFYFLIMSNDAQGLIFLLPSVISPPGELVGPQDTLSVKPNHLHARKALYP